MANRISTCTPEGRGPGSQGSPSRSALRSACVTPEAHLGRRYLDELCGITLASGLDADVTLLFLAT